MSEKKKKPIAKLKRDVVGMSKFVTNTTSEVKGFLVNGQSYKLNPRETITVSAKVAVELLKMEVKGLVVNADAQTAVSDNKKLLDRIEELEIKLEEASKYTEEKDVELANVKVEFDKLTAELAKAEKKLADYNKVVKK